MHSDSLSSKIFLFSFWLLISILYVALALTVRTRAAGTSNGNVISVGKLTIALHRIRAVPGIIRILPRTENKCKAVGFILTLVGLTPVLLPLLLAWSWASNESYLRPYAEQLSKRDLNFVQSIFVMLLWVYNRVLKCGFGVLSLPKACRLAGWKLSEWLEITSHVQSHHSLFVRDLPATAALSMYATSSFAYLLSVLGILCFIPLIFGGISAGAVGISLLAWSRAVRRHLTKKILADARPNQVAEPIVYLRAFGQDALFAEGVNVLSSVSIEESIILSMMSSGRRIVALGKPDEALPPLGAERFYVSNDDWQSVISNWLDGSYCIVMIAATTEATSWEMQQIFETNRQIRFILLFPDFKDSGASEKIMFERLKMLGVPEIDFTAFPEKQVLVGVTFDEAKNPILILSNIRNVESFEESIKWQFNRLGTQTVHEAYSQSTRKSMQLVAGSLLLGLALIGVTVFSAMTIIPLIGPPLIAWNMEKEEKTERSICADSATVRVPKSWTDDSGFEAAMSEVNATVGELKVVSIAFQTVSGETMKDGLTDAEFADLFMKREIVKDPIPLQPEQYVTMGESRWLKRMYRISPQGVPTRMTLFTAVDGRGARCALVLTSDKAGGVFDAVINATVGTFNFKPLVLTSVCSDIATVQIPSNWKITPQPIERPRCTQFEAGESRLFASIFYAYPNEKVDAGVTEEMISDRFNEAFQKMYTLTKKSKELIGSQTWHVSHLKQKNGSLRVTIYVAKQNKGCVFAAFFSQKSDLPLAPMVMQTFKFK